jgi:multiple antibiotic resistance protein
MLGFSEYAQFFIAMLAIVDPVTILPVYLHLVRNFSGQERSQAALKAALTTTIALVVTVFIGQTVLDFFGISIGSFQIAGGVLLMIVALQLMHHDDPLAASGTRDGALNASQVVVPLAIPLLAGPGAFSTVIVFSFRSGAWTHSAVLSLCLLLLGLIVWLALRLANRFMRYLSPTSISIVNKIMGLILAAISVEFIANGVKALFHLSVGVDVS